MSTAWTKRLVDLGERTGATFAQSFLATITVQRGVTERTALYTAAVAGAYATAKFLLAKANAYIQSTAVADAAVVVGPAPTPTADAAPVAVVPDTTSPLA